MDCYIQLYYIKRSNISKHSGYAQVNVLGNAINYYF